MISSDLLNLNQSPQELADLYGERDYYSYLRSPQFRSAFLEPTADVIRRLIGPGRMLDVGCGEGRLADCVSCEYVGFDGSSTAIELASQRRERRKFVVGRMEDPPDNIGQFDLIVFGGLLEVLIKPESRVDFVNLYRDRYKASYFVVYDLERLDTASLEAAHEKLSEHHGDSGEIPGMLDVKRYRKIIAFRYKI